MKKKAESPMGALLGGIPLGMGRTIHFNKQVDQVTIGAVTEQILAINADDEALKKIYKLNDLKYKPEPIEIYIDSYGGYVYQILGLVSVMAKSKTPIHTICTGAAMSCGFVMLICGHKRFAYELATPMYHQVSSGAIGTMKSMEEDVAEGKRLQKILEKITLENTKISKKKLKKIYDTKFDWFMTSKKALKLGVIDEII